MRTRKQVKFDVVSELAQAVGEPTHDIDREEFVLVARDMEQWRRDPVRRVPSVGHASAESSDTSNPVRVGSGEPVVQADRLAESGEQDRSGLDPVAVRELGHDFVDDLMVKADRVFPVRSDSPVVDHVGSGAGNTVRGGEKGEWTLNCCNGNTGPQETSHGREHHGRRMAVSVERYDH